MEKKFDVLLNQYNTLINQRPKTSDKSSTSSFHRSSSFSNYRSNEKNIMRLKEKRESNEKEDDERIDETIMEMMDVKKFEKEKNRIEEKSRIVTTSLINLFNLLQNNDTEMKERDVTDSKVRAITNENYHQLSLNVHTAVVHLTNVLQSATVVDANRLGPIVQSRSTAMLSAASLLSYSDEGPLDDDTIYSIIYDIARLMKDVIHTLQSQPSNDYVVQ
ncbi:hypothetical protein SNEBB_002253 [Seison nebaliae]|nr:hypothetical protein SNEBB_002253 [Seison nebaliae]